MTDDVKDHKEDQHTGSSKIHTLSLWAKPKVCVCVKGKVREKKEAEGGGLDWMSNTGLGKGY